MLSRGTTTYVAVIADMVSSKSLKPGARRQAQADLASLVADLNAEFRETLATRVAITAGDEFQALFRQAEVIPALTWRVEERFTARQLRLGYGFGPVHTPIDESPALVDGPALHNARDAIEIAERQKRMGGVFAGFGSAMDAALNGIARALFHQRSSWSPQQRKVVLLLHQGVSGKDAAERLGITKQAVSSYAADAGWNAYVEAEKGWLALLGSVTGKGDAE